MEDRLSTEIIADMETTLVNIEIALKKVKLMIEEILDDTEQEKDNKDKTDALDFSAQRSLLNTQAQIAHDYVIEIQNLIDRIQSE